MEVHLHSPYAFMSWTGTTVPFFINRRSTKSVILMRHVPFFSCSSPLWPISHHVILKGRMIRHDWSLLMCSWLTYAGWSAEFFGVKLTESGSLWRPSCVGSILRHPVISQIRTGASFYSCVHLAWWTVHSSTRSSGMWTEKPAASAFPLYCHQLDTDRKSP